MRAVWVQTVQGCVHGVHGQELVWLEVAAAWPAAVRGCRYPFSPGVMSAGAAGREAARPLDFGLLSSLPAGPPASPATSCACLYAGLTAGGAAALGTPESAPAALRSSVSLKITFVCALGTITVRTRRLRPFAQQGSATAPCTTPSGAQRDARALGDTATGQGTAQDCSEAGWGARLEGQGQGPFSLVLSHRWPFSHRTCRRVI